MSQVENMEFRNGERMKEDEASGQTPDRGEPLKRVPASDVVPQRRKIIGWMGVGIVGALAVNTLPFKLFSKKLFSRNRFKPPAKGVTINDMAVKRDRKARRNG
jgi:hypothetical protein